MPPHRYHTATDKGNVACRIKQGHFAHEKVNAGEEVPLIGGNVFSLPIATIVTPNLTPDKEGIGRLTDQEIARLLRYGVKHDGTAVLGFMPFNNASDEDLTAIISYLRSQPAVKNSIPENRYNIIGKAVKAFLIKPEGPTAPIVKFVQRDTTAAYGKYIANSIANCHASDLVWQQILHRYLFFQVLA